MGVKNIYERFVWFDDQVRVRKYPNATALAEKFEISTKTAQRDRSSVRRPPILTLPFKIEVQRADNKVFFFFSKLEDKLVFDFITALTHFPINLIQRCQREDCGGYFLKGTKKEKRFCSKRCAWIMASRERWRSQPEVEKEKRREYYRRKIRIERASEE